MKSPSLTQSTVEVVAALLLSSAAIREGLEIPYWRAFLVICAIVCAVGTYVRMDLHRALGRPREDASKEQSPRSINQEK